MRELPSGGSDTWAGHGADWSGHGWADWEGWAEEPDWEGGRGWRGWGALRGEGRGPGAWGVRLALHSWQPQDAWRRKRRRGSWGQEAEGAERGWGRQGWADAQSWKGWWRDEDWCGTTAGAWWEQDETDGVTIDPRGMHTCTLLFLHSCHGRPYHVEHFMQELLKNGIPDEHLRVVAPCAPRRACELAEGGTFQWFQYCTDLLQHGAAQQDDAHHAQLREQRARLLQLLEEELRRLPWNGRLVLGGLSQGASVALDLLLHLRSPLAWKLRGVISQRGMLQQETVQDLPGGYSAEPLAGHPVLATHGTADELVPLPAARRSYSALKDLGVSVRLHTVYGLGHNGYSEEEADVLAKFLHRLLYGP